MQFQKEEFQEMMTLFQSEIQDSILNMNKLLLTLEKENNDFYAIQELFREAHSIKGAARMVGFGEVQALAHSIENVMSKIKKFELPVTENVVETLFNAVDYIEIVIAEKLNNQGQIDKQQLSLIIDGLETINPNTKPKSPARKNRQELEQLVDGLFGGMLHNVQDNKVEVKKENKIENIEENKPILPLKTKKNSRMQRLFENLKNFNPLVLPKLHNELLNLLIKIKTTNYNPDKVLIDELEKIFDTLKSATTDKIFSKDEINLIEKRLTILNGIIGSDIPKTQEDVVEKIAENVSLKTLRVNSSQLDRLINQVETLLKINFDGQNHLLKIEKIVFVLQNIQKQLQRAQLRSYNSFDYEKLYKTLRNSTEDAFSLLEDVLEQINSLHSSIQKDYNKGTLVSEDVEKIIKNIRMIPFATILHLFPRMVKDIALEKSKQAELTIVGSDIMADKKIIDELKVSLIHILRNAVDHGIEPPELRKMRGKPPVGKIVLEVKYENNNILIEISDDGNGISVDKIKKNLLKKNLVDENQLNLMSNNQILNTIFWPEFSTQNQVTTLSGRGVGLDVAHNKISQLNGTISVKSQPKKGFKISIKIPVAIASQHAYIMDVNSQKFAIPSIMIEDVFVCNRENIIEKDNKKFISYNNNAILALKLSKLLNMPDEIDLEDEFAVLIINDDENKLALIAKNKIFEEEIIQKNLAAPLLEVKNLSGITTLSTGEICLILNSKELMKKALDARQLPLLPKQGGFDESNYSVLVVEDSSTTLAMQYNILINAGYNVDTAQNGQMALEKLSNNFYHLVISDIEMPIMSGFKLMEEIEKNDKEEKIKKILVSFLELEEILPQLEDAPVDGFVSKGSFSEEEFLQTVKKVLGG